MIFRMIWEGLCEATPWELIKARWALAGLCLCIWKMCQDDMEE